MKTTGLYISELAEREFTGKDNQTVIVHNHLFLVDGRKLNLESHKDARDLGLKEQSVYDIGFHHNTRETDAGVFVTVILDWVNRA